MNASVASLTVDEMKFSSRVGAACNREDTHIQADIVHAVERAGRRMFGGEAHVILASNVMKKAACFVSDLDLLLATPTHKVTEAEISTFVDHLSDESVFEGADMEKKVLAITIQTATSYTVKIACQNAPMHGMEDLHTPETPFHGKQQGREAVQYLKTFQRAKCRKSLPRLFFEDIVLEELKSGGDPQRSSLSLVLGIFKRAREHEIPIPKESEPGSQGAQCFVQAATEAYRRISHGAKVEQVLLSEIEL